MLKKLSLALLLLTGAAVAQSGTPTLVAHTESSGGTSSPLNTTGASAILVCTRQGQSVSDSAGNTFTVIYAQIGAYDGDGCTWYAAFAPTTSTSDTITVSNGRAFSVVAFSHVTSGPDVAVNDNASNGAVGPATPSKPNEVALTGTNNVFGPATTPAISMDAGWTQLPTAIWPSGTWLESFTVGYKVTGSGTPAAVSNHITSNQDNGSQTSLITLYSDLSPSTLSISPGSLPNGMRTAVYPQTSQNLTGPYAPTCFTPAGGNPPYTVTSIGTALPAGLSFDGTTHCITGTPTTTGTTSGLQFRVTDHLGVTADTPAMELTVQALQTTFSLQGPRYGFIVFPGAVRHPGVIEHNPGTTGKVDWSISDSTKGTISCTTNCAGTVTVTATGAAGTCTVAGTPGNYSIAGGNDFTVTATSRDANEDGSHSSDSETYHICKGDHLVDLQPVYNQAYFGQQKHFYSYVMGQVPQDGTWSCVAPDSSDCSAALDVDLPSGSGAGTKRHNRDVTFTAPSTVGSYKITFTSASAYDSTPASNYAWIYVGGALTTPHTGTAALPISPEGTEVQACFADPRFGSRSWTVKADGTGTATHIWQLATDDVTLAHNGGFIARIFNQDTTGTNPTQYPDYFFIVDSGTRDLPSVVCGVTDASGHLPILQRQGVTGSGRDHGAFLTGFPDDMIVITAAGGSDPVGYETSNGADFVSIWGLHFLDSSHSSNARAVWSGSGGRHLAMEGIHTDYMMDGALMNSNVNYSGQYFSQFQSSIGGYYEHCGKLGGSGDHCLYLEGMYPLVVDNTFRGIVDGSDGAWHKIRGGSSIVAFNSYIGHAGYPNMWFPAMSDSGPYTNVEMLLGAPGDTACGDSYYCAAVTTTHDVNWLHIADNEERLAHDYFYGNVMTASTNAAMNYSTGQHVECDQHGFAGGCTNGEDHIGGFFLWNNTLHLPGAVSISDDVFYNSNSDDSPIHSYPWLFEQNNSMWSTGTVSSGEVIPFAIDMSPYFQGGFQSNLIAAGSLDLSSPIVPGHTGWRTDIGGEGYGHPNLPWTAYSPKDSYLSGMNTFVTTTAQPYDSTTFKPNTGSPLIGRGAPITNPLMTILPLRYEADPVGGYVIPRTDQGATIGARADAASAFAPTVNVKTVGAVGNGTTDDRTAINSAIATACSGGGSVYFPAGTYLLSSPLTPVSCSALTMYGVGSSTSVLKLGGAGGTTYTAIFEDDGPGSITIHDMGFSGQNVAEPGPTFNGGVTTVNIYNVIVKNFGTPGYAAGHHVEHDGIYCNGCGTFTVTNSVVTGNERTGIEMPMTHTATVSGSILNGNGALGAVAESLAGTDGPLHVEALNNIMRGNGSGGFDIETENGTTPVAYGKMHGNLAENNGNDIYSDLAGYGLVLGNRTYGEISNNWVEAQTTHPALALPFSYYGDGIVFTPTGTVTVTNNYAMNGGNAGLLVTGGTGTVTGNWAIGNTGTAISISATGTITPNYTAAPSDTTPPSAPTGLVVTVASVDQVNLAWNESTDNIGVKGYNIYRNGTLIDHTAGTQYPDTGLSDTTGVYTVRAFDGNGNLSALPGGSPAATPTFSPAAGTYTSAQTVTISSTTSGATICSTTDGTTPSGNGAGTCTHGATGPNVSVGSTRTLKAIATKSGNTDSAVGSAAYTINIPSNLTVSTTILPIGSVGATYTPTSLAATGGTGPYTWVRTDSNTFPSGLTVLSNGSISGIPTAAGTYSGLTFRATDSLGATASSGSLTIVINPTSAPPSGSGTVLGGNVVVTGNVVIH